MNPALEIGLTVLGICGIFGVAFITGSFFGYRQGQGERDYLNDRLFEVEADRDARAGTIPTDPETGEHPFVGLESVRPTSRRAGPTPPGAAATDRETQRRAA